MLSDPDGTQPAYNKLAPALMILSYYLITLRYGCASVSGTDMAHICPPLDTYTLSEASGFDDDTVYWRH